MTTLLVTHPACLDHVMPPGHPECPDRLRAIDATLSEDRFSALARALAPEGSLDAAALCHTDHLIDELRHIAPSQGFAFIDGDTLMSPGTWEAILRGMGGAIAATEAVLTRAHDNAFVAIRPPGHHAEIGKPMGFCFFDNAAIAARHAQRKHGIGRVAVVDFDVHHGNGTQDIFWNDPQTLYVSTHQSPLYPGTGAADERGAHGNILNLPLAPGSDGAVFRAVLEQAMLPALEQFSPEFLFISAGFDACADDPLADLRLTDADFAFATHMLCTFAAGPCGGRVVSALEGGYDLGALGLAAAAHVRTLMEF